MKQIPIIAGKSNKTKPKAAGISPSICSGALQNSTNQERAWVLVLSKDKIRVVNQTSKGYSEVGVGGALDLTRVGSHTRRGSVQDDGNVTPTLDTGCEIGIVEQIGNIIDDTNIGFKNPQNGRIYSTHGVSPTINTCQGGGHEPKILAPNNFAHKAGDSSTRKRVEKDICPALQRDTGNTQQSFLKQNARIRKLTPKECFRLQGFPDEYFEKAQMVNSDSQLYKQSGNAVSVPVIYEIARRLE